MTCLLGQQYNQVGGGGTLRGRAVIGRYGGEEFFVILNSADAHAAQSIAQRFRELRRGSRSMVRRTDPEKQLVLHLGADNIRMRSLATNQ
jgi:PleD family two-component response regulator